MIKYVTLALFLGIAKAGQMDGRPHDTKLLKSSQTTADQEKEGLDYRIPNSLNENLTAYFERDASNDHNPEKLMK